MQRRSFNWVVALVGVVLAGVVAVSAATALPARSAASAFELVVQGRHDGFGQGVATFTSGAPFCESGAAVDVQLLPRGGGNRRYTCGDGSGTLTLAERTRTGDDYVWYGDWTIVEESGRYMGLRGKGTFIGELLSGDPWDFATPIETRMTLHGFVDFVDVVAPSLAFTSASPTKLRRPAGAYSIAVALSLRDDVEGNTVAYRLSAYRLKGTQTRFPGLIALASTEGATASGSVSTTLRVVPGKRVRSVQLLLSGSDPAGNEVQITRSLKLPR